MRRIAGSFVIGLIALGGLAGLGCPGGKGSGGPVGGGGAGGGSAEAAGPSGVRPRLVVLIVVDQLATWAFERDRDLYKGGFARLLRDGAHVRAGEVPYANPFTAPGHATIATGAPPSVHGVIGNSWYRRGEGKERPAEYDPDAAPFAVVPSSGDAFEEEDAASSRALRVEGVADALRKATGGRGRSVAISLKARGAVFVAGQRPELAVWYAAAGGGMTTSRAYAREAPRWLVELAKARPMARFFEQTWSPLDAAVLARATGIPDDAPGEGRVHGLGTTFPHDLSKSDKPGRAILHTPFADEAVLDAALAAIPALGLGADDVPDLLAVSFGAHDYAGHLWGPGSWEALDLRLRLDAALGRLFDTLDARIGRDQWAVVLTSDHGATPVVEQSQVEGARRVPPDEITRAVEGMLQPLGKGPWVAKVASGNVYLVPAFAKLQARLREEGLTAAVESVGRIAGIAGAFRNDRLAGQCAGRADLERAICWSIAPGESGELTVVARAGSLITTYETGTHHDAPFDDNRRVPIFVMAPGVAPKKGEGSLLQVAPTVAALLGVPAPAAAIGPPLFGIRPR